MFGAAGLCAGVVHRAATVTSEVWYKKRGETVTDFAFLGHKIISDND